MLENVICSHVSYYYYYYYIKAIMSSATITQSSTNTVVIPCKPVYNICKQRIINMTHLANHTLTCGMLQML